jgi:uncharacterized membrane protein YbhN (UPF0104 family)
MTPVRQALPAVEAPGSAAPARRRLRPMVVLNVVFLTLGSGLLAALILKLDTAQLVTRIKAVGWAAFLGACGCYVLGLIVTTAAWHRIIDPAHSRARVRELFAAFWAGASLNALTPGGSLGEVWRGALMRGRVDGDEHVASLVTLNFLGTVSMLCYNLLGPLLCLALLDLPARTVIVVFAVALGFALPWVIVYVLLRRGAIGLLVRLVCRLPLVRMRDPEGMQARARTIDARIREFRARRPRDFAWTVVWLAAARLLQAADYVVLLFVLVPDRPLGWLVLVATLTQAATQLLSWALTLVPSQIGVAEANTTGLFRMLGLDPLVGLTMEIVRHVRLPLGVAIGLLLGWILGLRGRRRPGPRDEGRDERCERRH